ncbi:MAG TPA: hypothetical protein DCZ75_11270 [Geobacter sp.]|nr:hypothetical protein [Geobacter sp.]
MKLLPLHFLTLGVVADIRYLSLKVLSLFFRQQYGFSWNLMDSFGLKTKQKIQVTSRNYMFICVIACLQGVKVTGSNPVSRSK